MVAEVPRVKLRGIPQDLRDDIEDRVIEFEREHQAEVLTGGAGWVPRVRALGLFPFITAGLPSYAVAFAVYAALMRLWILPRRVPDVSVPPPEEVTEARLTSA
jgi:hypothetical protein